MADAETKPDEFSVAIDEGDLGATLFSPEGKNLSSVYARNYGRALSYALNNFDSVLSCRETVKRWVDKERVSGYEGYDTSSVEIFIPRKIMQSFGASEKPSLFISHGLHLSLLEEIATQKLKSPQQPYPFQKSYWFYSNRDFLEQVVLNAISKEDYNSLDNPQSYDGWVKLHSFDEESPFGKWSGFDPYHWEVIALGDAKQAEEYKEMLVIRGERVTAQGETMGYFLGAILDQEEGSRATIRTLQSPSPRRVSDTTPSNVPYEKYVGVSVGFSHPHGSGRFFGKVKKSLFDKARKLEFSS